MHTSYHVHSNLSDGTPTIEEHIEIAAKNNLDEIGISDHYVLNPARTQLDWSMDLGSLDSYIQRIHQASANASGDTIVRTGIEADFFPETAAEVAALLAKHPLDYVIGSVHFVGDFSVDATKDDWLPLTQDDINEIIRTYWIRVRELAESKLGDFIGHLDLYKKFGAKPTVDLSAEINAALDAIAKEQTPIELNTSGWFKDVGECYPSRTLLEMAFERGIKVLVTADAHESSHQTRAYDRAISMLEEIGYKEQVRFEKRVARCVALRT